MRDIYQILRNYDFTSFTDDDLNLYADQCAATSTALRNALEVIGNLTFEAGQSEDYSPQEAKRDLLLIGGVMRFLPRLASVLSDNSDSATFEQSKRKGKVK
jgi:hypothetical protein